MHYRDLEVYKRSYKLALEAHEVSRSLPKELQYDLADQLRRAARAIPANIAEGCGRQKSSKDTVNFLRTALGSNDEVLFNIEFCKDARLISKDVAEKLRGEYEILGKQLNKLIQSISPVTRNQ